MFENIFQDEGKSIKRRFSAFSESRTYSSFLAISSKNDPDRKGNNPEGLLDWQGLWYWNGQSSRFPVAAFDGICMKLDSFSDEIRKNSIKSERIVLTLKLLLFQRFICQYLHALRELSQIPQLGEVQFKNKGNCMAIFVPRFYKIRGEHFLLPLLENKGGKFLLAGMLPEIAGKVMTNRIRKWYSFYIFLVSQSSSLPGLSSQPSQS